MCELIVTTPQADSIQTAVRQARELALHNPRGGARVNNLYETNPADPEVIERWRRQSMDGKEPPFRFPAPERPLPAEGRTIRVFVLGMAWGVLCSILAVRAAKVMGWLP